jgi:hypothetical protein
VNNMERSTIKLVAKIAPWLAPLPSAFFVARSGMAHLGLPVLAEKAYPPDGQSFKVNNPFR